ncbi:achaete-scute transcription factor-related protein [Tanacetum coccineum]
MEGIIKYSTLKLKKPERKIIEKNRRIKMKFLFSRLFSLIPPNYLSKRGDTSDRVDSAIEYIQALKTNLDMIKNKKDKLSRLKSHSNFRDVIWFLDQCTTEVTLANFSCSGYSIFHISQKKVGAEVICKRVKSLLEGSLNVKELENNYAFFCTPETLSQPRWGGTESQPREIEELHMNFHKELSSVSSCNELDYESNISIWDFDF